MSWLCPSPKDPNSRILKGFSCAGQTPGIPQATLVLEASRRGRLGGQHSEHDSPLIPWFLTESLTSAVPVSPVPRPVCPSPGLSPGQRRVGVQRPKDFFSSVLNSSPVFIPKWWRHAWWYSSNEQVPCRPAWPPAYTHGHYSQPPKETAPHYSLKRGHQSRSGCGVTTLSL